MEKAIGLLIVLTYVITIALCKAAKKGDQGLEHPDRIKLRGK